MRSSTIHVEMDDGSTLVVFADGRDIRAWEAKHDDSFLVAQFSYTVLTELAGLAAIRSGVYKGTFDQFMATAVNVKEAGGGSGGDPTVKDRGDEQSSPSLSEPESESPNGKKRVQKRS